jgi:putative tricarboxylic transport membrane protein
VTSEPKAPRAIGGESIIVICFVVLMSLYLYESFYLIPTMMSDYVGPSMFPQIIAITGLILAAVYFYQLRTHGSQEPEGGRSTLRAELSNLAPVGPILLYVLLLEPIGFLFATILYIFVAMLVYGRSWKESLVYALSLSIAFFVLFYYLLLAQIPMGWFIQSDRLLPFLVHIRRAMGG